MDPPFDEALLVNSFALFWNCFALYQGGKLADKWNVFDIVSEDFNSESLMCQLQKC